MSNNRTKTVFPAWVVYIISAVIIGISLLLLRAGLILRSNAKYAVEHCTEKIEAAVIKEENRRRRSNNKGGSYNQESYVVEFSEDTPLGRSLTTEYGSCQYDEGETVTVFYDPEHIDDEDYPQEYTWYLEKLPPDKGIMQTAIGVQGLVVGVLLILVKHSEVKKKAFEDRMRANPYQ